jgi:hypothetical protein
VQGKAQAFPSLSASQAPHPEASRGAVGLHAQMKTSLPWPSSMVTLLAGISIGPASAMGVSSPPFACGQPHDCLIGTDAWYKMPWVHISRL